VKKLCVLLLCGLAGCGGPNFRNVGISRDVVISTDSVESYATKHGVSNAEAAEALAQLKNESDRRRTKEHAAKYGISEEEAKRQLQHAGSEGNSD
jgi:hypothetical protein